MDVEVQVVLRAWSGGPTTLGKATVTQSTIGRRVLGAGKIAGIGLVVAIVLLPVPIIHLAGVGFFVACLGIAVWQLRPGLRIRKVAGPCPHCGHEQGYWLGINLGPMTLPKGTSCESCTKTLTIEGNPGAAS